MNTEPAQTCTAFDGCRMIASGPLADVALKAKALLDETPQATVLIFDNATSEQIEVDFRGTTDQVLKRLAKAESPAEQENVTRGPGRPKLGVVPREITLLPRHWDWLNAQPGGASVALRKLVDEAKRSHQGQDENRQARDAAYRFMSAMAGNLPGFEEATRALFSGNRQQFDARVETWPVDVRDHARKLVALK